MPRASVRVWSICLLMAMMGNSSHGVSDSLTPEEFVSFVEGAQGRVLSFDITVREQTRNTTTGEIVRQTSTITRWTPERSYIKTENATHDIELQNTRLWTKALYVPRNEEQGSPKGIVAPGPTPQALTIGWPVIEAIWSFAGMPWDWALKEADEIKVIRNPSSGLYELSAIIQSRLFTYAVDPTKGFVPVSKGVFDLEGSMLSMYQLAEFEEMSPGIWFPKQVKYTSKDGSAWLETVYQFEDIDINVEIPDEAFQIEFPNGTRVHDKILRRNYTIGKADTLVPLGGLPEDELVHNEVRPGDDR